MALVDTQSDVKYVCASSSTDSVVQVFFVIDCIRVGKGALVTAVAGWGNTRRCERDFLKSDVYRNSVGAVLMVCLFVFLWTVVQQTEACGNCLTDGSVTDVDIMKSDVRRMLGGSSCALGNPVETFRIAQNYCSRQIQLLCYPAPVHVDYGERCLVGACNGLVHGNRTRYMYSLVMQAVEVIVCLLLMFIEPEELTSVKSAADRLPQRVKAAADRLPQFLVQSSPDSKQRDPPKFLVQGDLQAVDATNTLRHRTSYGSHTLQF